MQIPIFDTHVHLNELSDPEGAILEAKKAGLGGMVAVGMDLASNKRILSLAGLYPEYIFPALGFHPEKISVSVVKNTVQYLRENLDRAVALGEVGLDYTVAVAKELQDWVFQDLLELAGEKNKPVILHSRLSHETAFKMVCRHKLEKVVFHWYSGPLDVLKELLLMGYYISATPALAYSPKHQEAVAAAPLKQILIETDSPTPFRGHLSSPNQVLETLSEVSRIKKVDMETAAIKTCQNAKDFFGII
jgi:TatD DNase family protein